jgi:hypothetical protein
MNTSFTPLHNQNDTCGPQNVPPGGVLGAAKEEGAPRAGGRVDTHDVTELLRLPSKGTTLLY